ncbi:MAG: NADH-quinone oxidoreductase subunit L [Anaeromyxobacter sp.]
MEHETLELAPLVTTTVSWLRLIPLLPMLGATWNFLFGKRLQARYGNAPIHAVAVGVMTVAFLLAVTAFVTLLGLEPSHRFLQDTAWTLAVAGPLKVDLGFALDPLSMTLTLVVTGIGTLIHVFSTGYMHDEKAYWRYFTYLNLFAAAMLTLVMGDNLAVVFFGWEGVGLASYLLIGFWWRDRDKAAAGMKAFVVNRVGDFGFLAGLLLLFWLLAGAWGTGVPAHVAPTVNWRELRDLIALPETGLAHHLQSITVLGLPALAVVGMLLFVGAMGKSAQLPLHVWLPDAMAGPTPVSALIHAATMVTAGVYLVARLNFVYALSPSAMGWVALIGGLTAFFAATIGVVQTDIKKVLAYSTVSQLGFMFVGVGVGTYWAGVYHLVTHAFFKAALFLGSGSVIMACHHEQDMRKMGGLGKLMPITRWTYLIATLAIAGFPVASGFYSKDEILWKAFTARHLELFGHPTPWLGPAIWLAGLVAATGTSFYMFRSYYMTFTGAYRGGHGHDAHPSTTPPHGGYAQDERADAGHAAHAAHADHGHHGGHLPKESPVAMTAVLIVLAAGAILMSFFGLPLAWTGHEPLLEAWLAPSLPAGPTVPFTEFPHAMEYLFQALGVGAATVGWLIARALYADARSKTPEALKARFLAAWTFVNQAWRVDALYARIVVRPAIATARGLSRFDGAVIDGLVNAVGAVGRFLGWIDAAIDTHLVDGAVNLVATLTGRAGRAMRGLQTGRIQTYLYGALGGALFVVLLNFLVR